MRRGSKGYTAGRFSFNTKGGRCEACEGDGIVKIEMHFLADVYVPCEVSKGKPAPDIYLAVAEKLQVAPARCLVFEDIIPGIMAGKNADMRVCAVEDEYSLHVTAEKKEMADYYIASYTEITF